MPTYKVTETIEYTVEAESEEDAEYLFTESDQPFNDFNGQIPERTIERI